MSGSGSFRGRPPMMVVGAALVLSTLISAWQAVRANSRAASERNAKQAEVRLRKQAQASERRAWEVAVEAQLAVKFLGDWVIGASRPADPNGGLGNNVTVREAINSAEAAAATAFPNQPLSEAIVRTLLGKAHADRGEPDQAIRQLEQAVRLQREKLGGEHLDTLAGINNLAVIYAKFGFFDKSRLCLEEAFQKLQRLVSQNHPDLLMSMHNLGGVYQNLGRLDQAIPLLEETLRRQQETFGREHSLSLLTMSNLAVAHDMAKDYSTAESLLRESLRFQQRIDGYQPSLKLDTQAYLGRTLLHQQKYEEAQSVLSDCAIESQKIQPQVWQTYYYQTLLGRALYGAARNLRAENPVAADKRSAKAEMLLRGGCEGMLARQDTIDAQHKPCLAEALRSLIELFEQLGRPEDAAQWRTKLEARTSAANSPNSGL